MYGEWVGTLIARKRVNSSMPDAMKIIVVVGFASQLEGVKIMRFSDRVKQIVGDCR